MRTRVRSAAGLVAGLAAGLAAALVGTGGSGPASAGPAPQASPPPAAAPSSQALRPPVASVSAVPPALTRSAAQAGTWLPYWTMPRAYADVVRHRSQIGYASPFWYEARSATRIAGYRGAGSRQVVDGLHRAGIRVIPTVVETMRAAEFARVLGTPAARARHVAALLRIARTRGYDGLDLDYEYFALTPDPRLADRNRVIFTDVARRLCAGLHARHQVCTTTVMARTSDAHEVWRGKLSTWIFDYRALGATADKVRIMAYSEHGGGAPGYLARDAWVAQITDYALATIPRARIDVSLATYGYRWRHDARTGRHLPTQPLSAPAAAAEARARHAVVHRDPLSHEPTATFRSGGELRTLYWADAASLRGKVQALHRAGVTVGFWVPGTEDAGWWALLAS